MDIHAIYAQIFKFWRRKRMLLFNRLIDPQPEDLLLDVGGYPHIWTAQAQVTKRIDCVNIDPVNWSGEDFPEHRITAVVGDGCKLQYADGSHDVLYSNSVIEHVGDWSRQQAFASEVRRVGRRLWVQTPAQECPVEPHYLAPFVHWLPVSLRRRILRWFTPWGWMTKPSQATIDETISFTRLLTKRQVMELFPDCEIMTERLFWIFPKSYIAYRVGH